MLRTIIFNKIAQTENLDKKIIELNGILSKDPENIRALEELGAIYYYQKKDDVAIEIYEKLIILEAGNPNIKGFLGYLYYEVDRLEEGIEILNECLDISPNSPFVYFILGNTYSRAGKIKDAIDSYDFAIFLDFDMYQAHTDFAKKYEDMGRIKRAIKEYRAAYEIDPRHKGLLVKMEELEGKLK